MKLVIIEPLGVEEEKLMEIAHKALYYGCKPAIEC